MDYALESVDIVGVAQHADACDDLEGRGVDFGAWHDRVKVLVLELQVSEQSKEEVLGRPRLMGRVPAFLRSRWSKLAEGQAIATDRLSHRFIGSA